MTLLAAMDGVMELAERFEGFSATPYRCPAGYPTIGWGHVLPSLDHPAISRADAEILLRADAAIALRGTLKYCPGLIAEPPARLAAIGDFTFNLGAGNLKISTLRRRLNQRAWDDAAAELVRWCHVGARRLSGLERRRKAEVLYLMLKDG